MSYVDIGFNEQLIREDTPSQTGQQLDALQFDKDVQEFSGSRMTGVLQSSSGRTRLNLDEDFFVSSDGVIDRVRLGKQDDGSYGLVIKDENGNVLMNMTGLVNILQSSSKHMQVDFNGETLIVTDEGGTPIVLVGRLS